MIQAVQQVLVTELMIPREVVNGIHNFKKSLHDFQLQCGWVDSEDALSRTNQTELDCTARATLRVKDNATGATAVDFSRGQAAILLQGNSDLSSLISDQLGEAVTVLRVEIEMATQARDGPTDDESSSRAHRRDTSLPFFVLGAWIALTISWNHWT